MKIAIFGAGIAGLSVAILLKRKGLDVTVFERSNSMNDRGNAFLMHEEGMGLLKILGDHKIFEQLGESIHYFQLFSNNNEEIKAVQLMPWRCFKRNEVIEFLYKGLGEKYIKHGHEFQSLNWSNNKAVSAIFSNGEVCSADLFIGADGLNSNLRTELFGPTKFSPIFTYELLGFLNSPELYQKLKGQFKKYHHRTKSIAFGILPSAKSELITVLQFDPKIIEKAHIDEKDHQKIAEYLLADFPEEIKNLTKIQQFKNTYIWKTRDFDLLEQFHKKNVILIGDSAHVALPFSSSGTTNAILDSSTLSDLLESFDAQIHGQKELAHIFNAFYNKRSKEVEDQIYFGRKLKDQFLSPVEHELEDHKVPLVKRNPVNIKRAPWDKRIQIKYFTDPICSTCWAIQPQLRKLELKYGNQLEIDYRMGGLLPHWHNYNRHGISQPDQVAEHWNEVETHHQMPISGEIWKSNPLPSSYPPSIAFKAAQLQNPEKAIIFLRKIREALFVAQKNIIDQKLLYRIALSSALDAAKLLRDINQKAKTNFLEDLELCEQLQIKTLPTLIFSNHLGDVYRLEGIQKYEVFEKTLFDLNSTLQIFDYNKDPLELFSKYPSMSLKEYSYLSEKPKTEALAELKRLCENKQLITWQTNKTKLYLSTVKLEQGFV